MRLFRNTIAVTVAVTLLLALFGLVFGGVTPAGAQKKAVVVRNAPAEAGTYNVVTRSEYRGGPAIVFEFA